MHEERLPEIASVFRSVMETQALLIPETLDPAALPPEENGFLASSMTFSGSVRGGLLLAVPERTAWELAANFLGLEADDPFARVNCRDSLGEILNATCGRMLSALFGSGALFDLSLPTPLSLSDPEVALLARKRGSLVFSIAESPILLQATFCPPGASV